MNAHSANTPNPFAAVQVSSGGNYHSWQTAIPGTTFEGTILKMDVHTPPFEDAEEAPRFLVSLPDGSEQYILCSQANLKRQVVERGHEFAIGGYLKITYSGNDGRVKLFTVEHTAPTQAPAAAPAPAAPPVAPPVAPAPAPQGQPSPLA